MGLFERCEARRGAILKLKLSAIHGIPVQTQSIIEFDLDEPALAASAACAPVTANQAAMEETYFVMPVRVYVGGTDVLAMNSGAARPLPLIGFATDLRLALEQLEAGRRMDVYLAGGDELSLCLQDDLIEIQRVPDGQIAKVARSELRAAARSFSARVRATLLQRVPELRSHPNWLDWFPEDGRHTQTRT